MDTHASAAEQAKARWQAVRPVMAGVVLAISLSASAALAMMQKRFDQGTVVIDKNVTVRVSVADTHATREKGLSGRAPLASDEGMLFIFEQEDRYAFWMKDMRFAIDIIWIKDGAIADITTDVAPSPPGADLPLFFPRVPVDTVLEVPAGFAKAHGLRTGMTVAAHVDKRGQAR